MTHDTAPSGKGLEHHAVAESNEAFTDLAHVADDALPALAPECQGAWKVVHARVGHDTKTYRALRYLLSGYSYRAAATAGGLADQTHLSQIVTKLQIHDAVSSTRRALIAHRRIRQGAQEILLKKLENGELDHEKPAALSVVMGIADDKIRAHEEKQGSNNNALGALEAIGERLIEAGVKIDLSISPVVAYKRESQPPRDATPEPVTLEAKSTER